MGRIVAKKLQAVVDEEPDPIQKPVIYYKEEEGCLALQVNTDPYTLEDMDDFLSLKRNHKTREVIGFRLAEIRSHVRGIGQLHPIGDSLPITECLEFAKERSEKSKRPHVADAYASAIRIARGIDIPPNELQRIRSRRSSSPASSPAPMAPAP